ncbi:MAG: hypothetical protein V4480_04470 [Patescibacteria group bacterium]
MILVGTDNETDIEDSLVLLIKNADNTFGPMGSGGYSIKELPERPDKMTAMELTELDRAPASRYPMFIKGNHIWATRVADWMMALLRKNAIDFSASTVPTPPPIEEFLESLKAAA